VVDADSANVVPLVSDFIYYKTSIGSLILAEKYPTVIYPACAFIHGTWIYLKKMSIKK
jgi:hypothetical protein